MHKRAAYTYPTNYAECANYTPGVPRLKSDLIKVFDTDHAVKAPMPKDGYADTLKSENTNSGLYPTLPLYESLHPWDTISGTGYGRPYWISDRNHMYGE